MIPSSYPTGQKRSFCSGPLQNQQSDETNAINHFCGGGNEYGGHPHKHRRQDSDASLYPAFGAGGAGHSIPLSGTTRLSSPCGLTFQSDVPYSPSFVSTTTVTGTATATGYDVYGTAITPLIANGQSPSPWSPFTVVHTAFYDGLQSQPSTQFLQQSGFPYAAPSHVPLQYYNDALRADESSGTLQQELSYTDQFSNVSIANGTMRDDVSDVDLPDMRFPEVLKDMPAIGYPVVNTSTFENNFASDFLQYGNFDGLSPETDNAQLEAEATIGFNSTINVSSVSQQDVPSYHPFNPFEINSGLSPLLLPYPGNLSVSPEPKPSVPRQLTPPVQWNHTFFSPTSNPTRKTGYKDGGVHNHLSPALAKKKNEQRKFGSCLPCWLDHMQCSVDPVCTRCAGKSPINPWSGTLCNRMKLPDYASFFCPEELVSHLHDVPVEGFVKQNVHSWVSNNLEVHVTEGAAYPGISLVVQEFCPAHSKSLELYGYFRDENGEQKYGLVHTLPVGIRDPNRRKLKDKCSEHIKQIVEVIGRDPQEAASGQMAGVSWRVLRAIERYYKGCSDCSHKKLLCNSLMLYAMHYFNGHTLTFTEASIKGALNSIRSPAQFAYKTIQTSRILGCQLKAAMQSLILETYRSVLTDLERVLRLKSHSAWTICFCVILMLCMTAESVQIAIDGFVIYTQRAQAANTSQRRLSRDTSLSVCKALDDRQFKHCMDMFHGVYRSAKPKTGAKGEKGFNPLRDGLDVDTKEGFDEPMVAFVKEVQDIYRDCGDEMRERSRPPSFDSEKDDRQHHAKFRQKNPGRLLSIYLKSFMV